MAEEFDLIGWQQQQINKLREQVKDLQTFRNTLEATVIASEWKKPGWTGAIFTNGHIPIPLAISAMASLEVSIHWLNEMILHLNRQDSALVKEQARLIESKATQAAKKAISESNSQ